MALDWKALKSKATEAVGAAAARASEVKLTDVTAAASTLAGQALSVAGSASKIVERKAGELQRAVEENGGFAGVVQGAAHAVTAAGLEAAEQARAAGREALGVTGVVVAAAKSGIQKAAEERKSVAGRPGVPKAAVPQEVLKK